jgi:hypothetical protein
MNTRDLLAEIHETPRARWRRLLRRAVLVLT